MDSNETETHTDDKNLGDKTNPIDLCADDETNNKVKKEQVLEAKTDQIESSSKVDQVQTKKLDIADDTDTSDQSIKGDIGAKKNSDLDNETKAKQTSRNNKYSFKLLFFSFLIPIIGYLIYSLLHQTKPQTVVYNKCTGAIPYWSKTVVVIGDTGCGKSFSSNCFLNLTSPVFNHAMSNSSVTQVNQSVSTLMKIDEYCLNLTIVDTPGFNDRSRTNIENIDSALSVINELQPDQIFFFRNHEIRDNIYTERTNWLIDFVFKNDPTRLSIINNFYKPSEHEEIQRYYTKNDQYYIEFDKDRTKSCKNLQALFSEKLVQQILEEKTYFMRKTLTQEIDNDFVEQLKTEQKEIDSLTYLMEQTNIQVLQKQLEQQERNLDTHREVIKSLNQQTEETKNKITDSQSKIGKLVELGVGNESEKIISLEENKDFLFQWGILFTIGISFSISSTIWLCLPKEVEERHQWNPKRAVFILITLIPCFAILLVSGWYYDCHNNAISHLNNPDFVKSQRDLLQLFQREQQELSQHVTGFLDQGQVLEEQENQMTKERDSTKKVLSDPDVWIRFYKSKVDEVQQKKDSIQHKRIEFLGLLNSLNRQW